MQHHMFLSINYLVRVIVYFTIIIINLSSSHFMSRCVTTFSDENHTFLVPHKAR